MTDHANLIAGQPLPSESGRFDVRAAIEPFDLIGRWPVSSPDDVGRAIDACGAADTHDAERVADALEDAAAQLEAHGSALLCRRIGLGEEEFCGQLRGLRKEVGRVVDRTYELFGEAAHAGTARELALLWPDWTELYRGPLIAAATELMRGRSVILIADERVPMAADDVAFALIQAGLPAARVAVVHGVKADGIVSCVRHERVVSVRASGDRARVAGLRSQCEDAGVREQQLHMLRAATVSIGPDEDPEQRAGAIVESAFGRGSTLSGQRHGQVGRVFCHARVFSTFTAALLARLEADEPAHVPIPTIDRFALARIRREWAAGLDEGATLIAGGAVLGADGEVAPGMGPKTRCVAPSVFTNVEPHMALLARQAPMPIVCLVRTFD